MGATKRDLSGVFAVPAGAPRGPRTVSRDPALRIGPHGMTFIATSYLPEWTEVNVELQVPGETGPGRRLRCHGVIVQCQPRLEGQGYEVALLFLDLPARADACLRAAPHTLNPPIISIAR